MQYLFKKTTELDSQDWSSYISSYKKAFDRDYSEQYLKRKYLSTIDKNSYHLLLIMNNSIIGGITVIPYEYYFGESIVRIGLAVDVFIIKEYRIDFLTLYHMYDKIEKEIIKCRLAIVIGVPNNNAYNYWKSVLKWKEIGCLSYYTLPIRIGNYFTSLPNFVNLFTRIGCALLLKTSYLVRSSERDKSIRLNRSNIIDRQRYSSDHKQIHLKNGFFSYRLVNERNVRTCYLIDFYDIKGKRNSLILRNSVRHIISHEKIDLIVYIGQLSFSQLVLLKVPVIFQPRRLHFMIKILVPDQVPDIVHNLSSWDFGLFNYDVR